MDLIKIVDEAFANEKVAEYPKFKAGDTITVTYRIKEGDKERLQKFRGVVIQLRGASPATKTFTIRKISNGKLSGKKARIKEKKVNLVKEENA